MTLLNLNKLFVRVTDGALRDTIITKSKEPKNNKIYFLSTTNEIITQGIAYGLSTDVQEQIAKVKSILKEYYTDGSENAVKVAIDAVQKALDTYKTDNDAKRLLLVKKVAYNDVTKAIDFTSEDETTVQSIPVSKIIGNHIVNKSVYNANNNHLTLTFAGAEAPVDVDIDLGKMLDMNDVVSGDTIHFKADYADGKLTIKPVMCNVADVKAAVEGEHATPAITGLVDALDVKTYIDAAVSGAQGTLQIAINNINSKLNTIQGDENTDGSINKALKDANAYTDTKVGDEANDRKADINKIYGGDPGQTPANTISSNATNIASLLKSLNAEVDARKKADDSEKTAREQAIQQIIDTLNDPATFWEDYTSDVTA